MNEIQFLMYEDSEKVEVVVQDETIWATQKTISKLFDVGIPAISKHLKNIFDSGELIEDRTISKMETVQKEGGRLVKKATTLYKHPQKDKQLCDLTILQFVIFPDTVRLVSFN